MHNSWCECVCETPSLNHALTELENGNENKQVEESRVCGIPLSQKCWVTVEEVKH